MDILPLHTLTPESKHNTLRFETIDLVAQPVVSSLHRHDYYEIFLFRRGGGTHMIDFAEHPIQDKSLHLVCPGQVHRVSRTPPSEGWVVMFSRDVLLSLLYFQGAQQQVSFLFHLPATGAWELPQSDFDLLQTLFQQIQTLYLAKDSGPQNTELVRALLKVVVLKCAQLGESCPPAEETPAEAAGCRLSRQFMATVEERYKELHQVAEYANLLAVTAGHLNVVSKARLGKTASEVIQERLLLEAKRLLLHSDMATKEIAYSLNFEDPSHFGKFIKSHCGVSPSAFRQQMREIYQQ